jgi:hypothetical protein
VHQMYFEELRFLRPPNPTMARAQIDPLTNLVKHQSPRRNKIDPKRFLVGRRIRPSLFHLMPPKCSNNLRTGQQCQNYAAHPKPFCNGCIREYGPNGNVAPVQQPQPSHSAVQLPALCKAKDCDLYGSRDGYCSKHYNQQLSEIKSPKPVQVPPPAQVSQSVPVLDSKSALHRLQEILSRSRTNSAIQGRLQNFLNALSEILALARDQEHSREKELECIHEIISCLDEKDSKSSKISEVITPQEDKCVKISVFIRWLGDLLHPASRSRYLRWMCFAFDKLCLWTELGDSCNLLYVSFRSHIL